MQLCQGCSLQSHERDNYLEYYEQVHQRVQLLVQHHRLLDVFVGVLSHARLRLCGQPRQAVLLRIPRLAANLDTQLLLHCQSNGTTAVR